jgi:O-antigen/teichoic acid export membrane protein
VLLSFFSDPHSVGIFSAAIRFTKIANLLPAQVKFAILPTMYRFVEEVKGAKESNENKAKRIFEILLKYMGIFAALVAIGIFLFSDPIIHIIFGNKYNKSIPLVQLFSMFIYLRFIETPFKIFFIAMEKHKNMVLLQGFTSFLNVVLNFALIPSFSVYGAFYSTLVSEIFFALMLIYSGAKHSIWMMKDIYTLAIKPAAAGAICFVAIMIFKEHLNIIIQVLLFIISYTSILFLLKTFDKSDKELFLKIFLKSPAL